MSNREVKDRPKLEPEGPAPKPLTRREEKHEGHLRAIMAAANQLVNEVGYDAMTMDDLAIRAGLSKPTLYQYFRSKQDIWIKAVIDRIEGASKFASELDQSRPAIERLESIILNLFDSSFCKAFTSIGPAVRTAIMPALKADPEYKRTYGELFSIVCDTIDEARAQGNIANGIPTRLAAQVIVSILRDSEYSDYIERGECHASRLSKTLARIVLEGITPRPISSGPMSSGPVAPEIAR